MGTSASIAILNSDETVQSISCHFDGYTDGVGKTLLENYVDESTIRQLLSFGNMSSLGKSIATSDFYGRDRGDDDEEAITSDNVAEYLQYECQSYIYLFKENEWYVYKDTSEKWKKLK